MLSRDANAAWTRRRCAHQAASMLSAHNDTCLGHQPSAAAERARGGMHNTPVEKSLPSNRTRPEPGGGVAPPRSAHRGSSLGDKGNTGGHV